LARHDAASLRLHAGLPAGRDVVRRRPMIVLTPHAAGETSLRFFDISVHARRYRLPALIGAALLMIPLLAGSQATTPLGWTSRDERGTQLLTPGDLAPGAAYTIAVFPLQPAGATMLDAWLQSRADADAATTGGRIEERAAITRAGVALLLTSRVLRMSSGAQIAALYFSAEPSPGQRRLVRVLSSSADLIRKYQTVTMETVRNAGAATTPAATTASATASTLPARTPTPPATGSTPTVAAATAADVSRISRDVVVRTPAPRNRALTAGGPLVPGTYVGQQINSDTKEVLSEYTLQLYPNGEYRHRISGTTGKAREDTFAYDPVTGRIDLNFGSLMQINNSRINPDRDFAVLGRATANGTPVLYAENDRGYATNVTALMYTGPNAEPTPSAARLAAEAAEAEAARYKYVVRAGRGIQDAQIAGVYLRQQVRQTMGLSFQLGISTRLSLYLLLTDGTVHDGMPVAPDEMDIATSRQREPNTWGRWRRAGNTVQVAWNKAPQTWEELQGNPVVKARPTDVLQGRFSGGASYTSGDVASYSLYGITFGPGQRFETDSRSGSGTGTQTAAAGGVDVQTTSDDNGSTTTVGTGSATATTQTRDPRASRSGTYRISGWNFEARYGDGRVVRAPFFFLDAARDALYWDESVVRLARANGR
jgi:hypothetical protein